MEMIRQAQRIMDLASKGGECMERSRGDVRVGVAPAGWRWTLRDTLLLVVLSSVVGWYVIYIFIRWLIALFSP